MLSFLDCFWNWFLTPCICSINENAMRNLISEKCHAAVHKWCPLKAAEVKRWPIWLDLVHTVQIPKIVVINLNDSFSKKSVKIEFSSEARVVKNPRTRLKNAKNVRKYSGFNWNSYGRLQKPSKAYRTNFNWRRCIFGNGYKYLKKIMVINLKKESFPSWNSLFVIRA